MKVFAPDSVIPSKIIIGDDHPLVLNALRAAFLEVWPDLDAVLCLTLDEVMQAVSACESQADVVLLDLTMPGSNGLDGLVRLLKSYPSVPVVVISAHTDIETVKRAMALGASGYLAKSLELDEMTAAISRVLNGELCTLLPLSVDAFELQSSKLSDAKGFTKLSGKQLRILQLIVEGKLNKQIAAEIGIAEQTVKIHVSSIFKKLGVRTRTQAAIAAQRYLKVIPHPQKVQ